MHKTPLTKLGPFVFTICCIKVTHKLIKLTKTKPNMMHAVPNQRLLFMVKLFLKYSLESFIGSQIKAFNIQKYIEVLIYKYYTITFYLMKTQILSNTILKPPNKLVLVGFTHKLDCLKRSGK